MDVSLPPDPGSHPEARSATQSYPPEAVVLIQALLDQADEHRIGDPLEERHMV